MSTESPVASSPGEHQVPCLSSLGDHTSPLSPLPPISAHPFHDRSPLTQDPWILQNAGRPRYTAEAPHATAEVVPARQAEWPPGDQALTLCVERVDLRGALAEDPDAGVVEVRYDLLGEALGALGDKLHRTGLRTRQGTSVAIGHAVAHWAAGSGAGEAAVRREMAVAVRAGRLSVPFTLVGAGDPNDGERELARCAVSLQDLLDGRTDMAMRPLEMTDPSGRDVATLWVSIRGWECLYAAAQERL